MEGEGLSQQGPPRYGSAEIGALAHLYRAECYRSTVWRTRLDTTTNWAVVTTGIALSVTFANAEASPFPLVLVGLLLMAFLTFEARRYRYFDVWRVRARVLESHFYVPLLLGQPPRAEDWHRVLAEDLRYPRYHLSYAEALGRRLRRNYAWILMIQAAAYYGKLAMHPTPVHTWGEIVERAAVGPVPGLVVVLAGVAFHAGWIVFALLTLHLQTRRRRILNAGRSADAIRDLVAKRA